MSLRIRRGTEAQRQTALLDQGELAYTTDTHKLFLGDGTTIGGVNILATSAGTGLIFDFVTQTLKVSGTNTIVEADAAPSLGGNLNLNSHNIVGNGNISTTGTISNGTLTLSTNFLNSSISFNINALGTNIIGASANGSTNVPKINFESSRGTVASPTAIQLNDTIGAVTFNGWNGTAYRLNAIIQAGLDSITTGSETAPGRLTIQVRSQTGSFSTASLNSFGVFSSTAFQANGQTQTQLDGIISTFSSNLSLLYGLINYNTTKNQFQVYQGGDGLLGLITYARGIPISSKGSAGDVAGMVYATSSYIYTCYANYTTGTNDIWARAATTGTTF
jgi:polyisoprenoid-binding protein YceI